CDQGVQLRYILSGVAPPRNDQQGLRVTSANQLKSANNQVDVLLLVDSSQEQNHGCISGDTKSLSCLGLFHLNSRGLDPIRHYMDRSRHTNGSQLVFFKIRKGKHTACRVEIWDFHQSVIQLLLD